MACKSVIRPHLLNEVKNSKVYVQAGAGIVADSDPKSEYLETYNKALAVINAVKNAGEVEAI